MGILLGLLSAFAFGTADFAAGRLSRALGALSTLFYIQFAGFLFLSLAMTVTGQWHALTAIPEAARAGMWMALDLIGILLLYRGLQNGKASVVAPIASSFSAVTIVFAVLAGERLAAAAWIAIAMTVCGVICTTVAIPPPSPQNQPSAHPGVSERRRRRSPRLAEGAALAMLASLFLGVAFFGLRYPAEELGGIPTVWVGRLIGTLSIPIVLFVARKRIAAPTRKQAAKLLVPGILDGLALVSYNIGLTLTHTALVISAVSLFAVFTLLWGISAGERLSRHQWLGVALTFAGIVWVSAY